MSNSTKLLPLVRDSIYFDALYAQSMQAITEYAGQTWTDTGEHDPGVTFMEGFSYSVSDLAYRHTLPLVDLLTPSAADQTAGDGIFPAEFGPQMALTSGPITIDDYRRALLDLTDDKSTYYLFRNVQLLPLDPGDYSYYYDAYARQFSFEEPEPGDGSQAIYSYLRGNYALYLEPARQASQITAQTLLQDFLTNNRNMGETVSQVIWVASNGLYPTITVELEEDAQDIAGILANIYSALESYFSPPARRYLADDPMAEAMLNEDIYDGPNQQHGWIIELPPKIDYSETVNYDTSHVPNVLLSIKGIKNVQFLSYKTSYSPTSESYSRLWGENPTSGMLDYVTLISAGGEYVTATQAEIDARLVAEPVLNSLPVVMPYGKSRDVSQYHPVSDKVPPCYGLQQLPPPDVQPQLYQFLLPFEQMMANGGKQLSMLPQLLSFKRTGDTVWGEQWPYAPDSIGAKVHASYSSALIAKMQANADDYDQELAVLSHLLEYFGTQSASRMLDTSADEFLTVEQGYLANITELAYQRDNIRIDQVSALQKRIAARMGFGASLFREQADMSQLPFYLVEHRELLPVRPAEQYNTRIDPSTISVDQSTLTVTEPDAVVDSLQAGQLIDFVLMGGLAAGATGNDFILQAMIVDDVNIDANTFSLIIQHNPLLQIYMDQIVAKADAGELYWRNCQVWLQDIEYPLHYVDDQRGLTAESKKLTVSGGFLFPALMRQGDTLMINALQNPVSGTSEWSLEVIVQEIDDIAGTFTVTRKDGESHDYPDPADVGNYYWYDKNYIDRFSFVVSVVLNKSILPTNNGDPYTTELWIKQCVQAEMPAHVSVIIHWLDDATEGGSGGFSFQDFARTYSSWQGAGTAESIATYQLLWMLSLGVLPSTRVGVGTMIIASEDQRTAVIGKAGDEWNISEIVENSLFFVPKTYTPAE